MNTHELLDLVIAKAPQLRSIGVSRLQFPSIDADGLGVTVVIELREPEPEPVVLLDHPRSSRPYVPDSSDPLYDEATYGGGGLPGFDLSNLDKQDDE